MKKNSIVKLRNEDICLVDREYLFSLITDEKYALNKYNSYTYEGNYMFDVIAVDEGTNALYRFIKNDLTFKAVGLSEEEKHYITHLKELSIIYLARDGDGALFGYNTNALSRGKYSAEWSVDKYDEHTMFIRLPQHLFTIVTSKDICPTSILELGE